MKNRPLVMGVAVGVCLLLVAGVGALAAVASSGETLDVSSGVSSRVPEGWAVSELSGQNKTVLVPSGYEHENRELEVGKEIAVISYQDLGDGDCEPQSTEVDDLVGSSPLPIARGYDESLAATGNLASGEGTVAGHAAKWTLEYGALTGPWFLPGKAPVLGTRKGNASDYPIYTANVALKVCVKALGLGTSYEMGSDLFEDSSKNPEDEPTRKRNAFVADAREEVHQDLRRRYEANIQAMMEFLRAVDTDGWDGSTELDDVPTSLEGYDEALEDPFQGRLEEPSKRSAAKQPSGTQNSKVQKGKPTPKKGTERTSPSRTTGIKKSAMMPPLEAAVEDAVRGHYEAIGAGDFARAYDYFGPTYRAEEDQHGWVESHEADQIRSSTINSLKVEEVSGSMATADVDVSFEDKTGTPRFLITWRLVKEGGRWKLDEQLSAEKTG